MDSTANNRGPDRVTRWSSLYDARIPFLLGLAVITLIGLTSPKIASHPALPIYLTTLIVFVGLFLFGFRMGGRLGPRKLPVAQLRVDPMERTVARGLFLLGQLYFITLPIKFIRMGGLEVIETLRTDSDFIGSQALLAICFSFCLFSLVMEWSAVWGGGGGFRQPGKGKVGWGIPLAMTLLLIVELLAVGSRAFLFSVAVPVTWIAARSGKVKMIHLMIAVFGVFFLVGVVGYIRITSNETIYRFWLNSGIVDNQTGWLLSSWKLLVYVIEDMVYRPLIITQEVWRGRIDLQHGNSLFFFITSLLPGHHANPAIWLNHNVFWGSVEDVAYPPNIVAQFFWDFGLPGVVLGALLTGWMTRILIGWSLLSASPIGTFLYSLFCLQLLLGIYGEFSLGWWVAYAPAYLALRWCVRIAANILRGGVPGALT